MAENWSRQEVEAIVADYFEMWHAELRGESFNKAAHNRALREVLNNRSESSVEMKHQNISAVLIDLGIPYIDGYKPRRNYQALLREVIEERLKDKQILQVAEAAVTAPAPHDVTLAAWDSIVVQAPKRTKDKVYEKRVVPRHPRLNVNYLEIEARNRSLGLSGEEFVLALEHRRLWDAGHRDLAERIEHSSKVRGDGLGYDIHSFETTGKDRLIEVKTTRYGEMTPFFASRSEVDFSAEAAETFHLFRVFNFSRQTQAYILKGSLKLSADLQPYLFEASVFSSNADR